MTGRRDGARGAARPAGAAPSPRIARLLLALLAATLAASLVLLLAWIRARERPRLDRLSQEQRLALAGELLAESPGLYTRAWFEPRLAHVLRPEARLSAWGVSFRSNELGFRAPPAGKPRGTFRVLFVGDSWTFGMGVSEEEAYPARVAALARARGAAGGAVQAWPLALPGYNTLDEIAAVEHFLDVLAPDAVVLAPTLNDVDSSHAVLPNGSLTHIGATDSFGGPHPHVYRVRMIDSHVYLGRWRRAMAEVRRLERRLAARGVPLALFFTARWRAPFAARLVAEAGLESPYVVLPGELAGREWTLERWGHPNAAGHARHAEIVYDLLAHRLGWPARAGGEAAATRVVERPGPGAVAAAEPLLRLMTQRQLEEEWAPSPAPEACVGPGLDCATGRMSRGGSVLLRRRPGATRVEVVLRRVGEIPSAYPMRVWAEVPSAAGGRRAAGVLGAGGAAEIVLTVPLPADLGPGRAFEVVLLAERAPAGQRSLLGRSLRVAGIRQR